MDLIYANTAKEDIGVMRDFTFDLAFGGDENDFECRIMRGNHCCNIGYYLYCEGTEYGGVIDNIESNTDADEVTYSGRTWHGVLNSKVLEPDVGEGYLILNGEANQILSHLIDRMGLSNLFSVPSIDSGISISNYKMNRYIRGYDGIRKMLKTFGAKLNIVYKNGIVNLTTAPLVDYSKNDQFDTDQISLRILKKGNPINHMICLGKGELVEREVIHLYTDKYGNICPDKTITGIEEVCEIYENSNAETSDDLREGGIDKINESWNSDEIECEFNAGDESYDVGDIVGAKDNVTGVEVVIPVTKKIIKFDKNTIKIQYKVGE